MTKEEFITRYAARSGMTVERLGELNQEAYPCDCGDEDCHGWQMVYVRSRKVIRHEEDGFDPPIWCVSCPPRRELIELHPEGESDS